jgi:exopolysaccharide biosynthesis polyprenyl glycosylphosphotransferase
MLTRRKLLTLTVAEGLVLWLTIVAGVAFADDLGLGRSAGFRSAFWPGFAFAVTCVIGLYFADLYDIVTLRRNAAFLTRLPLAIGVALILLGLLYVVVPNIRLNSKALLPCATAAVIFLLFVRAALNHVIRRAQPERILVLGGGDLAARVVDAVTAKSQGEEMGEHVIVGVVDVVGHGAAGEEKLDEVFRSLRPDRIVVADDRQLPLPLRQLLECRMQGIAVEDWVPFYERLAGKVALESLRLGSVAFGDGFGEARLHAAFARAMGLVAALIGLIALTPFLLLIGVAIRVTSPGPVLFVHPRIGRNGRPFGLLKLRTMYLTDKPPSEWVQDNEYRVTPIGRLLRRFRIDELPQLLNVLKGDMNLVGPRPHPVSNYNYFMDRIPHYALRSVVRPGITGWAQVHYGYANNLEQETEKMCFDLFYIRNVSIWLDLRVLLQTVRVVARGHEGLIRPDPSGQLTV